MRCLQPDRVQDPQSLVVAAQSASCRHLPSPSPQQGLSTFDSVRPRTTSHTMTITVASSGTLRALWGIGPTLSVAFSVSRAYPALPTPQPLTPGSTCDNAQVT